MTIGAVQVRFLGAEAVLTELEEIVRRHRDGVGLSPATTRAYAEKARSIYRARRGRANVFGGDADLFADPAWDLLLDLFVAHESNKSMSVSSACIAAAVPPTTALRWIALLEKRGLIERRADSNDSRRSFLDLSSYAYLRMQEWLRVWAQDCAPGADADELGRPPSSSAC